MSQRTILGAMVGVGLGVGLLLAATPASAQWCAMGYDMVAGTNLGVCPPPPADPLYKRLGEKAGIEKVTGDFVAILARDPRVSPRFTSLPPARVDALKKNLVDQVCQATGGPCTYTGKDMKTAHTGMNITDAEWTATVQDLTIALDGAKVGPNDRVELIGKLAPMRTDIVGR